MSVSSLQEPTIKYPVEEETLGQFFFNRCTQYSDRICQIDGADYKSETYGSVKFRSIRVAIELQKRKIKPSDVISVCSNSTLDCFIPIVATFFVGAKVANLDPTFSVRHVKHLISLVTPKMIFVEASSLKLIEEALEHAQFETEIVVFGSSERYSTFSDFDKAQEKEEIFTPVEVDSDETAIILFNSGATGPPRAVCHSHRSFLSITSHSSQVGLGLDVIYFTTFYPISAMMITTACLHLGNYRVFFRSDDSEEIFKIIDKYKVKCVSMPCFLTYKLADCKNVKFYDTSSVTFVLVGGAPIATSRVKVLMKLFPRASTRILYGKLEFGLATGFDVNVKKAFSKEKYASAGTALPGVQLKVVDLDTREPLGSLQKGEVCVSSTSLMKSYHKQEVSDLIDENGFFKSGDVGYYDDDGCWYILDRIKEMFKYRSVQIIPATVEEVLLQHPSIKEAVVFGIPHDKDGELPAACIVRQDGCNLNKEEIHEFIKGKVAEAERLSGGVVFVDAIPRTGTGKVTRKQVREFALSRSK